MSGFCCCWSRVSVFTRWVRAVCLVGAGLGAIYWVRYSLREFPWIVPADHSEAIVRTHTAAAMDGMLMVSASFVLLLVASGLLGSGWWSLGITVAVLVWLLVFPFTYPSEAWSKLAEYRRQALGFYVFMSLLLTISSVSELLRVRNSSRVETRGGETE